MKFIVDAQLPYGLTLILRQKGYDVIHTDDLPDKEKTTDNEIRRISKKQNRIVITKDTDFEVTHFLNKAPAKILLVTTGNIRNKKLLSLFNLHIKEIEKQFKESDFIEIDNYGIISH